MSDAFRRTRVEQILPALLSALSEAGVDERAIAFLFATGTHRGPTVDEQRRILGSAVFDRFRGRIWIHDPHDEANLVAVGVTSRGTAVTINKRAAESDRLIATGTVVFHYFGGFGGGRKSILPGISGVETIAHNHAMNLDPDTDRLNPDVRIGRMDGNPVAEDMLEGARLAQVDFVLNTVLNRQGEIAGIFAGELDEAHRAATAFARDLYAVTIHEQADLVIAASGATRNFVQTHKALYNAYQAVKPTGRIVLAAPCDEGLGGDQFAKWLRLGTREAIIAELRRQSEINGQTALSTIEKAPLATLVTDLSAADVGLLGARRAPTLGEALDEARGDLARRGIPRPTIYVMPSAAYTVPFLET